jgi:hypothetical protein
MAIKGIDTARKEEGRRLVARVGHLLNTYRRSYLHNMKKMGTVIRKSKKFNESQGLYRSSKKPDGRC